MSTSRIENKLLWNNPFFVLNVSCSADRRAIAAAADERSFFEDADKCVEAQNALLNPGKRLSAELDWFPDTDEQNVEWVKQSIESGGRIPVGEFGAVSQLNAELYNLGFFDITQPQHLARFERALCSVDRLYSQLNGQEIAQMLNQHRKAARMTEVSVQEVEQELVQKRYRIRKVLSECLQRMGDADCTEKVLKIAQTYIEGNKGNPGIILLDFVSQYELRMQPKIDALAEKIDAKINFCKMRTGGVLDGALDDLMKEVSAWAVLVKPMMICGKANGRSHEGTSAMGNKLRNLALFLHNEKEQTAAAAKLTEAMLGIFTYDRMFYSKLTEEVKTLKKLSSQRQSAESLKEEIDQLLALVNSAENWSVFEISGKMEELALLVMQLDKKLRELAKEDKELHKIREVVAMAARSASVVLHNKYNMTQMAVDFMAFLMELFSDIPNLHSKLRNDKADLDRQLTLAKQLGVSLRRETVPFQSLASQASDVWLLNKGNDYQNKKDYKNAFLYYKRAADMGNADAQNRIGVMYHRGEGVTKNYEEALRWYHKAVENGDASAANNIANAYEEGWGVEKDKAAMFRWKLKAAGMGHKDATTRVGYLYYNGIGTQKDYGKAQEYFEKGAALGDTIAMSNLGYMYRNGIGVKVDKKKALYWYEKAADNKYKDACIRTAQMYENGEGTQKDLDKARKYYMLGAELGDKNCIVPAALMCDQNADEKSKKEAFRLYNQAIDQGVADSQTYRNLGVLYMNGQGTEKNYEKAREMLNRAGDAAGLSALEQRIREDKNKKNHKTMGIILAAILTIVIGVGANLYSIYSTGMESIGEENNQIEATLMETFYYGKAVGKLQRAVSGSSPAASLSEAKKYLSESGKLQNVNSYFTVIEKIEGKDYRGALKIIESFPETQANKLGAENWKRILRTYISQLPKDDLQNRLSELYLTQNMYSSGYDEKAFEQELSWGSSEITTLPESSGEVEIPSLQHIYDTYGKKAAGKILIVKQCKDYPGQKQTSVISLDLMEHLPAKYLPMSVDEVSYVIVVSYGYIDDPTGDYQGSTDALIETGSVTVYSMEADQKIYSSKVVNGASPPMFFSYQGAPPAYKSGGKPDVYGEFLKALRKVMK